MRVLSVLTAYPPSTGGAQIHAHILNQRLAERGHDVEVATAWRATRTDWALGTTIRAPAVRGPDDLDGLTVRHLGLLPTERLRAGAALALYPPAMRQIAPLLVGPWRRTAEAAVHASRPDVLHLSRIGREWPYEAVVQAAGDRPFVLTPNHHPHWTKPWHWWWWDLYRRADRLLVLSDHEADALVEGGVDPQRIIRTVVGPVGGEDISEPTPPSDPPTILFLGQIRHYKGLDVLVDAMPLVRRAVPEARLSIVGPWLDAPDGLRARCEADPQTTVHGAVDDAVKWQQLQDATLLCVPSSGEALGGVYLEAWTAGRPAIGADIPPVRELMDRTGGGLVVDREPERLAATLIELLEDPGRAAEMGETGRSAIRAEYNWEVAAARAEHAYEAALGAA